MKEFLFFDFTVPPDANIPTLPTSPPSSTSPTLEKDIPNLTINIPVHPPSPTSPTHDLSISPEPYFAR